MTPDYPKPPFPAQKQSMPGSTGAMQPRPDHGESSYKGSGKLKGMKAVITGADSAAPNWIELMDSTHSAAPTARSPRGSVVTWAEDRLNMDDACSAESIPGVVSQGRLRR